MTNAAGEGLWGLLSPGWHAAIAVCLLIVLVLGVHRLIQRGPSRMGRSLLVIGALIVGLMLLGMLLSTR